MQWKVHKRRSKKKNSYIGEVVDTLFGTKETEAYVISDDLAKSNWYLYEDEY